jgi:hypothetical protein
MKKNVCYALDYKPVAGEKVVRAGGRAAQKQPALRCPCGQARLWRALAIRG